jgi:hypothetical protein
LDKCRCGAALRLYEEDTRAACTCCEEYPADCPCFPFGDEVGALVLIWVKQYVDDGHDGLMVNADLHILDGPDQGEVEQDVRIFGTLAATLAPGKSSWLLGRIQQHNGQFDLVPHTTEDLAAAQAYLRPAAESTSA